MSSLPEPKNSLYGAVLTTYVVNYQKGLPGKEKTIILIQMFLTENGFLFRADGFDLYINYNKVIRFEPVKGMGLVWTSSFVWDNIREKLFEITYLDNNNLRRSVRFEIYVDVISLNKNYNACRELLWFLKDHGLFDKFISSTQDNTSTDIASQIEKLAELHKSGILTDEEFQSKKTELLKKL